MGLLLHRSSANSTPSPSHHIKLTFASGVKTRPAGDNAGQPAGACRLYRDRPSSPPTVTWRLEPESNRRTRICSPLHDHSAIQPRRQGRASYHLTGAYWRRSARLLPGARRAGERDGPGGRGWLPTPGSRRSGHAQPGLPAPRTVVLATRSARIPETPFPTRVGGRARPASKDTLRAPPVHARARQARYWGTPGQDISRTRSSPARRLVPDRRDDTWLGPSRLGRRFPQAPPLNADARASAA